MEEMKVLGRENGCLTVALSIAKISILSTAPRSAPSLKF